MSSSQKSDAQDVMVAVARDRDSRHVEGDADLLNDGQYFIPIST